jgi:hypothetical protein
MTRPCKVFGFAAAVLACLVQSRVAASMTGDPERYWNAAGELLFYAAVLLLAAQMGRWLRYRLPASRPTPAAFIAAHAWAIVVLVTILLMPFIFCGYGKQDFGLWLLVWGIRESTLVVAPQQFHLGGTITYHFLVEALAFLPLLAWRPVVGAIFDDVGRLLGLEGVVWLATASYYGVFAVVFAASHSWTPGLFSLVRRWPVIAHRFLVPLVFAALVVSLQWALASIPTVNRQEFNRRATELQRTARWRYGYVHQYHGAVLVKTRTRADASQLRPRAAGNRLAAVMARDLRQRTGKAWLELAFYGGLFVLYRFGRNLLYRVRMRAPGNRLAFGAAVALATALFVTAVMTPYLLYGYGEPLFSNRVGPGALTSTSLVPTTAAITSAISYRLLLQQLLIWPLMSAEWAAEPLSTLLGIRGSLWLVAVTFWTAIGTFAAWFSDWRLSLREWSG